MRSLTAVAAPPQRSDSLAVSCAIMAHPRRQASAERIAGQLAALSPQIVYDPDPSGPKSSLRAALAAWSSVALGATHQLVVQDDVLPTDDFVPRLLGAVARYPRDVLCAFCEWGCQTATMVRWAAMRGVGLVECTDIYVPTQATVLPVADAVAFVSHATRNFTLEVPDDIALRRYLAAQGRSAYALAPNLVDHDVVPSLVGNESHGARSAAWLSQADDPGPAPGVLHAPSRVPIQTWSKGRSISFGYHPRSAQPKYSEPTRRLLARRGLAGREIADGLDKVLESAGCGNAGSGASGPADLELLVGYGLLHELWVTSIALGALLPAAPGLPDSARSVLGPAARRALRTMGPGALRCFVSAADLAQCEDALTELITTGVGSGLAFRDRSADRC